MDLSLKASVVVANGARDMAENIFVGVTLYDGSVGYGEVAPFPHQGFLAIILLCWVG